MLMIGLTSIVLCVILIVCLPLSIYYYLNKELNVGSLFRFLKEVYLNDNHKD